MKIWVRALLEEKLQGKELSDEVLQRLDDGTLERLYQAFYVKSDRPRSERKLNFREYWYLYLIFGLAIGMIIRLAVMIK